VAIFDRLRNINKSPSLPQGAVTTTFTQEQLREIVSNAYQTGSFEAMQRNPFYASTPFGSGNPLIPAAINNVGEDGRPDPRKFEYPVAWNVFVTEQRLVPWKVLRLAADQIDILRRCVEVLKSKVAGMDWDVTFSDSASELFSKGSDKNHVRAMQDARDEFGDEIARLRTFWQTPDRINGLGFKDWVNMVLEDLLVLDAIAIHPRPDMKGDLHSLVVLDATTIKPVLDEYGNRPMQPFPAYQQILYGFPRGEYTATSDDASEDGNFTADDLIYLKRNHRTWTPYGYSPVERSLPVADIYIKRQQWLRAEFTDGVLPQVWLKSDGSFVATPEQLRAYEAILNDDLAGQTEQRHRARLLPAGLEPVDNSGSSEKFNDTVDNYLITSITGHFGVLPTEIGFSSKGGLGASGHQDGEAEAASRIGAEPLVKWLEQQLSDISYKFLGMPRELVFKFQTGNETDTGEGASRRDTEIKSGQRTINEAKAELGLPLVDSEYADMPMIQAGANTFFISPEGIIAVGTNTATPADTATNPVEPLDDVTDENVADPLIKPPSEIGNEQAEVKAFLKWAKKSQEREFEFVTLDSINASALNRAYKNGDTDLVKALADGVLKKA
jgi:hypothetical protein